MSWSLKPNEFHSWIYETNFFSVQECNRIIDTSLNLQLKAARIGVDPDGVLHEKVRKNTVGWLNDGNFDWVYRRIVDGVEELNKRYWQFDLSFIEDLQFTVYDKLNDHYDYHIDMNMDSELGPYRKLSFSIQLSNPNDYEGSELQINTGGSIYDSVPKEQGTLIAFPSFIMHKVTPLTKGKRYSLVAWIHGPNWK